MSKSLSLDEILGAKDVQIEQVETPMWGGHVYMRSVSGDKRDEIDLRYQRNEDGKQDLIGVRAFVVGTCMCDESGNFVNPTVNQIKALGKKSGAMLDRCFDVCQRINGMRQRDVEQLEKNSQTADENDSGS